MTHTRYKPGRIARPLKFSRAPAPLDKVHLDTSSFEALARSVKDYARVLADARQSTARTWLFDEMVGALSAGCIRAAMVMLWGAAVTDVAHRLWERCGQDVARWNTMVAAAKAKTPPVHVGVEPHKIPELTPGDFDIHYWQKKYTEQQIIYIAFSEGFFSADALEQLYLDCFRPRCRAAHPSATVVTIEDFSRALRLTSTYLFV